MSGSKTVYYVSSSTVPLFDPTERTRQLVAALLDYTANSSVEWSEYLRNYCASSRMVYFKTWRTWWQNDGFTEQLGMPTAMMYSDVELDYIAVGNALLRSISVEAGKTLTVYKAVLNVFSEDFYIKYLATQQGMADKVYQASDTDYTISYSADGSVIIATFSDGIIIQGKLPSDPSTRVFMEISYSISSTESIPSTDKDGNPIQIEETKYEYGFYHYGRFSGNSALDAMMQGDGTQKDSTFYPPIPIRSNTAWFTGTKAQYIGKALKRLGHYNTWLSDEEAYSKLCKTLTDGMKSGSISDIDYITLFPGVSIGSTNQHDLKYVWNFFYNLYVNGAIAENLQDYEFAKLLTGGKGYTTSFFSKISGLFKKTRGDSYYNRFTITSTPSNLNISYNWGGARYWENNGTFRPGIQIGDYGVLTNKYTYYYPVWDSYRNGEEEISYITYAKREFTLTVICRQESLNRYKCLFFIDPVLTNLVYAGKSISTTAYETVMDSTAKEITTLDFSLDVLTNIQPIQDSLSEGYYDEDGDFHVTATYNAYLTDYNGKKITDFSKLDLFYITSQGDLTSPFIVPLEKNTLFELSEVDQLEISYGGSFFIFNCWVSKKIKWYQTGFFGFLLAVIGVVLLVVSYGSSSYFSYMLMATGVAMTVAGAFLVFKDMLLKIFTAIFGEYVGQLLFKAVVLIIKLVAAVLACYPATSAVGIGILAGMSIGETLESGGTLWAAVRNGIITAVSSYIGSQAGQYAFNWGSQYGEIIGGVAQGFAAGTVGGFAQGLLGGANFRESFISALRSGAMSGLSAGATRGFKSLAQELGWNLDKTVNSGSQNGVEIVSKDIITSEAFKDIAKEAVIKVFKDPSTYAELHTQSLEIQMAYKLSNLQNKSAVLANQMQAAYQALTFMKNLSNGCLEAQQVLTSMNGISDVMSMNVEAGSAITEEQFLTASLLTGSDAMKITLGSPSNFVSTKLSLNGYEPYNLYQSQTDYTSCWDVV